MDIYRKSGSWLAACAGCAGKTLAEFLHTSRFHDARLGARVERVRFRSDIALEQWVRLAVDLDRLTRIKR